MKLDKIHIIVSLLVIGGGIFSHSITLKNELNSLSKEHNKALERISTIEDKLSMFNSKYSSFDSKIDSNEEELIMLRESIEKTGDILRESTSEIKKILIDYLSKK